jgi:hypothetical protein
MKRERALIPRKGRRSLRQSLMTFDVVGRAS